MRRFLGMLLCCVFAPVVAQSSGPPPAQLVEGDAAPVVQDDGIRDMEAVVVSGVLPGPGLWRVRRGDHTLHILGTVSPLPKGMDWRSDEVDAVLEEVDAVLGAPGLSLGSNIGMWRGLTLLPSAMRAANNPGGRTLDQVLPPELHARWLALKAVHMGRDRGVEKKRPMFAAFELYEKASERAGLRGGVVGPVIDRATKRRRLKPTSTVLALPVEDPRAALAEFRAETLGPEEIACFTQMLDVVEHRIPELVARANAWAVGDVEALRSMPLESLSRACISAWSGSDVARTRGFADVDERVRARWMEVAEAALDEHAGVFATVPVAELLRPGGYLERLAARGYEIESP